MIERIDDRQANPPPTPDAAGTLGAPVMLPARAAKILVVEDDPEMRALLDDVLRDEGYGVVGAADALTAFIYLASEKVDVVITDWKMPGSDGLDLLESVRRCFNDLPVIMVTAFPTPDLRRRAFAGGVIGFLPKPFSISDLMFHVRAALDAARGSGGRCDRGRPHAHPDDTGPTC